MTRLTATSDGDLLRQVALGDEDAFLQLYRRWQSGLFRFALHMSGSRAVAEDVTQEAFMTLIREPERYDAQRGTLGAFLYGIARNLLLRRWENESFFVPLPAQDKSNGHTSRLPASRQEEAHPANELIRDEAIARVRNAILSLPVNYREAVVLCDLEEMSYAEAAERLGCAVGTVRSRLHRGRELLAEKLRQQAGPALRSAAGS